MFRGAVWGRLYFENMKSHAISTYFKFVKKSLKMPELEMFDISKCNNLFQVPSA